MKSISLRGQRLLGATMDEQPSDKHREAYDHPADHNAPGLGGVAHRLPHRRASTRRDEGVFAIASLAAVAVFSLSVVLAPGFAPAGTKLFIALVVALISADFLGAALRFTGAHQALGRFAERLQVAVKVGAGEAEVMRLFMEYNGIVEAMPQFSAGLYDRNRDELNSKYGMWKTGPQP